MPPPRPSASARNSALAVALIILGLTCQEVGAALAVLLFPVAGPIGTVTMRLAFSAAVLLLVCRPRLRGRSRKDWLAVVLFGGVVAGMNATFYLALERLPLGPAVTIEYLGPLLLSVILARRLVAWLWAALALAGVALLGRGGFESLDPIGVLFALTAGALWMGYILLSRRVGRTFRGLDGLAIAMSIGALGILPWGVATSGTALLNPWILLLGLGVAVLSTAIPYGAELIALRQIPAEVFSIVISCAPAIAALAGLVVLQQALGVFDLLGILLVVAASMGAVIVSARRSTETGWQAPAEG